MKTTKLGRDDTREGEPSASMSSMEVVVDEEIGRVIKGRYEIVRIIGEGGMGVVYEAFDRQVDRPVAIKLVRAECVADKKFLTRFRREMEVTTKLRHPSTIRVFEHGETEEGRPFMVMELLRGLSLASRLEKERISEIEALQIARQVAESLSEAHDAGIFHRDLKPDNIFIETVGVTQVVKVLDFGIAGGLDSTRLTQVGEVFGTPQYMSPEQCNGQQLDHRTDIYSLGCILYEMIEGRPPFTAETAPATMLKHVRAKMPNPRHASRETTKLLQMALRKDRNKRIQTCARFAQLLGECIGAARSNREGNPRADDRLKRITTGPIPALVRDPLSGPLDLNAPPPPPEDEKRNRVVVGVMAAAFVALVAVALFGALLRPSTVAEADDAKPEAGDGAVDAGKLPRNRALVKTNVDGATVFLDDVEKCQTPCTIEVPVGDGKSHEVRITKDGYVDVVAKWQPSSVTQDLPELPDLKPLGNTVRVK